MELMCNETFKVKDLHNIMECLDFIAKNTQNQDITGIYEALSKTQPYT